jgi:hypothetical protein
MLRPSSIVIAAVLASLLSDGAAGQTPGQQTSPTFDQIKGSSVLFRAVYSCRNEKGSGCSAGCASASFSPLKRLTVTLYSLSTQQRPEFEVLHYLVEFPQTAEKAARGQKAAPVTKAEGFILDAKSLCGTINMDLSQIEPTQPH